VNWNSRADTMACLEAVASQLTDVDGAVITAPSTSASCDATASRQAIVSARLFQFTTMTSTAGAVRTSLPCGV
jgi:hypothetical protein